MIVAERYMNDYDTEDGGMAMIAELDPSPGAEAGIYFRIVSWDSSRKHDMFRAIIDKKVRITLEVVE